MSGGATWLHGQRKIELVALAEQVGLQDYEHFRKPELEAALEDHIRANQRTLSKEVKLQPFFERVLPSPVKKERTIEIKTLRTRRTTQVKYEVESSETPEPATSTALIAQSPPSNISFPSSIPIPPSPAVIASQIDRQTTKVRRSIGKYYEESGIPEASNSLRDRLSNTVSIESLALLVELYGLQSEILPSKHLAIIPASRILGTPDIPIKFNDLFALLTPIFWSTFSAWLITSVLLPLAFSYFFNLTLKAKRGHLRKAANEQSVAQFDPLTFNLSKALIIWLVYQRNLNFGGLISSDTVERLDSAIPGSSEGIIAGTVIGTLTSLYEAILRN